MNNLAICLCNYKLVVIPVKYISDLELPEKDIKNRRAKKYVQKHTISRELLTIYISSKKPYRNPTIDTVVRRVAKRNNIDIESKILQIEDVEIIRILSKPSKQAL